VKVVLTTHELNPVVTRGREVEEIRDQAHCLSARAVQPSHKPALVIGDVFRLQE
jgi:hypothetical protein